MVWTLAKLERCFKERIGRAGSWKRNRLPFKTFLSLFPKTFQLFGSEEAYVRLFCTTRSTAVETGDEVMKRLAKASLPDAAGYMKLAQQCRHPGLSDDGQCLVCLRDSQCRLCINSSRQPSSRQMTPPTPRSFGIRPTSRPGSALSR